MNETAFFTKPIAKYVVEPAAGEEQQVVGGRLYQTGRSAGYGRRLQTFFAERLIVSAGFHARPDTDRCPAVFF